LGKHTRISVFLYCHGSLSKRQELLENSFQKVKCLRVDKSLSPGPLRCAFPLTLGGAPLKPPKRI